MELPTRKAMRCKDYDYSQQGMYYVTICLKQRILFFGTVNKGVICLNKYGKIAEQQLMALTKKFSNADINEYIIMPDHVHAIVQIKNPYEALESNITRRNMLLPKIIGFYKMNVAKQINLAKSSQGLSLWQHSYFEHIIRSEQELYKIKEYILNNPAKWNMVEKDNGII
jgi:REP element-mobilizing transposase RayT